MAVRERRVHVLQTAEELKALRSPVRNRLLEVLRRMGEASVGTLAQRLGLKPESLYYHVNLLAKVGLIVLVREQHTGRRPETIYAPVAPNFSINRTNRDPDFLEALLDVYRSQLRLAERELEDAMTRERESDGIRDKARVTQYRISLRPFKADRLLQLIKTLDEFLSDSDDPGGSEEFVVTVAVTKT